MNVTKLFKQYMVIFLKEHDFSLHDKKDGTYVFKHKENSELWIIFRISITKSHMYVDIRREYQENWPGYNLQLFLEDVNLPDRTINQPWYFDTEEEFIGALEEQARLLDNGGFDLLHGRSDYDIEKLVTDSANQRAHLWQISSETERENRLNEYRKTINLWKQGRVKPVLLVKSYSFLRIRNGHEWNYFGKNHNL